MASWRTAGASCLVACLVACLVGCKEREAPPPPAPSPTSHAATAPAPAPVQARSEGWLGVIVARSSVDVTSDSQGRLAAVHVQIGDQVQRGDRIASLDTRLVAQDLEMARS